MIQLITTRDKVNKLLDTAQPNMSVELLDHFKEEWENYLADRMVGGYTAVFDEFRVRTHGDSQKVNPAIAQWENQKLREALTEWLKELNKE